MPRRQGDLATGLWLLAADVRRMLTELQGAEGRSDVTLLCQRLALWIETLDTLAADAETAHPADDLTIKGLLIKALSGGDLDVDGVELSLHDITQLAAALRPGASLTVRNSESLTPIEQTSIWTVMPGQVRFA